MEKNIGGYFKDTCHFSSCGSLEQWAYNTSNFSYLFALFIGVCLCGSKVFKKPGELFFLRQGLTTQPRVALNLVLLSLLPKCWDYSTFLLISYMSFQHFFMQISAYIFHIKEHNLYNICTLLNRMS
jgi:hypothetical protein